MDTLEKRVQTALFGLQDLEYKAFQSRLMPTIDPDRIIGIRTPQLRKFAKEFIKTGDAAAFLEILPHTYYEENNLHGFLIESMKDFDQTITALDAFLPYVDNWATCDLIAPKIFKKYPQELFEKIKQWIAIRSDIHYPFRYRDAYALLSGRTVSVRIPCSGRSRPL